MLITSVHSGVTMLETDEIKMYAELYKAIIQGCEDFVTS
jgi:hypothetical protein